MDDMMLWILVGLFILFILYTLMRRQDNYTTQRDNRDYRDYGDERPRYDDPDIQGRGSFGKPRASQNDNLDWMRRRSDNNNIGSSSRRPTNDSPNVQGRGSFGKDKG